MQINPIINLGPLSLPLPIYKSLRLAETISKDDERFSVFVGLDANLALQLKNYSLNLKDIELQKYTSDLKRFGLGSYEHYWYKKNRTPFALVQDSTGVLAAIVWLGPEALSNNKNDWHTIGWRSYIPFRGKEVTKDFCNFSINFYLKHFPNIRLWVSIKKENIGSRKLASNLGFKILEEKSTTTSVIMVKENVIKF